MKKSKDKKLEKKSIVIFAILMVTLILFVIFLYNNKKIEILNITMNITKEDRIYWNNYFNDENRINMIDLEFNNIKQLNINDFVSLAEDLYIYKPLSECITEICLLHPHYINWLDANRDKYPKDECLSFEGKDNSEKDLILTFNKEFIDNITLNTIGKKYNHDNADKYNKQYGVYYMTNVYGREGSYAETKRLYYLDSYKKIGSNKIELEIYEILVAAKSDEEKNTFIAEEKFNVIKNNVLNSVPFYQVYLQTSDFDYHYRKNRIVLEKVDENKYYYVSNSIIDHWTSIEE